MSCVPDDYEMALEEHEQRIEEEAAAFAREDRKAERSDEFHFSADMAEGHRASVCDGRCIEGER